MTMFFRTSDTGPVSDVRLVEMSSVSDLSLAPYPEATCCPEILAAVTIPPSGEAAYPLRQGQSG